MGQITIYLDDESESQLKSVANAAGISVSRYVAESLHSRMKNQWPDSVRNFPGSWDESVQRPGEFGKDLPRERL